MVLLFIILFSLTNILYIKIWRKFSDKVPTGIGILLTIPCFFFYLEQNLYFANIILLLTFSFAYFLDDLVEISFLWRILLQIFGSLVIFFSTTNEISLVFVFFNLLVFFILVNTLNFQDGEDSNIAILLFIVFIIFYFYSENNFTKHTSKIILLFLISFSFFNIKKNFLYFGDSGCYFISIIIFLFVYNELHNMTLIKMLISVIIFPVIDVFYVALYRIFKKENLLSRNHLHLYQVIAKKLNLKLYLLPNIFFSFLNIFISFYIPFGINFIVILVISNIILLFAMRYAIKNFCN